MVRMSVDQRRTHARAVARQLLGSGTTAEKLTLRPVAEASGTPLATLTYAYRSVTDLLADLRAEFEAECAENQRHVGGRGLRIELARMLDGYLDVIAQDRANAEIVRWQMLLIARGDIVLSAGLSMRACLRHIQEQSGEQWRLSVDELSTVTQAMVSGMHVQFLVRGADPVALRAWREDAASVVDAAVTLAQPTEG